MTLRWLLLPLFGLTLAVTSCSSSSESCNDISWKICDRLAECESRDTIFATADQCAASFDGLFEANASDSGSCQDTWAAAQDLDCAAFLDYFQI